MGEQLPSDTEYPTIKRESFTGKIGSRFVGRLSIPQNEGVILQFVCGFISWSDLWISASLAIITFWKISSICSGQTVSVDGKAFGLLVLFLNNVAEVGQAFVAVGDAGRDLVQARSRFFRGRCRGFDSFGKVGMSYEVPPIQERMIFIIYENHFYKKFGILSLPDNDSQISLHG